MAKLPYTYTVCPTQEDPKQFTASCSEMGLLLKGSINGDLTIDDRRNGAWQAWDGKGVAAIPFEEAIRAITKEKR